MRLSKAVIAALLMALLCSMVIVSDGSDATVEIQQGDMTIILDDDYTAEINYYYGPGGDIVIPSSVSYGGRNYSVTSIGLSAFTNADITSVVFPDTLRIINPNAFMNCDALASVTLNEGLETIGSNAFYSCDHLSSIYIPSSVECIEAASISGYGLETITVSPSNMYYKVVDGVLFSKDGTRLVSYPGMKEDVAYVVPSNVSQVDRCAFYGNYNLNILTFNEGLTYLSCPIDHCSVEEVCLPSSLMNIDNGLAIGALDTILLSGDNTYFILEDGILYDSWMETVIEITTEAGTDITISEGVTLLGRYSADYLTIDNIFFPSSLETIFGNVFSNTTISEITIPASVKRIGYSAFYNTCLEDITFMGVPDQIQGLAFFVRSSVLTEHYAVEPVPLEDYVRYNTNVVYVPLGSEVTPAKGVVIGDLTFDLASDGTAELIGYDTSTVNIPGTIRYNGMDYTVTSIKSGLFIRSSIISISIPGTITTIERRSFHQCFDLETVELGEGITHIGYGAFRVCHSLTEIHLPSTLECIEAESFDSCASLGTLTIPESNQYYKTVDNVLFTKDGTTLCCYPGGRAGTTYTVPDTVRTILDGAISYNQCLKSLYFNEGLVSMGDSAVISCFNLRNISIPSTLLEVGDPFIRFCFSIEVIDVSDANPWYTDVDGVMFTKDMSALLKYPAGSSADHYSIPEGVRELTGSSFEYSRMDSLTLPSTLETIGKYSFQMSMLPYIIIPDSVKTIDNGAFVDSGTISFIFEGVPSNIGSDAFDTLTDTIYEYFVVEKVPLEDYAGSGAEITYIILGSGPVTQKGVVIGDLTFDLSSDGTAQLVGFDTDQVEIPSVVNHDGYYYTVTSIKPRLFQSSDIISISVPGTVHEIGAWMFSDSQNLTYVVLNEGVESIGYSAFRSCVSLECIIIPPSLKTISGEILLGCNSLSRIAVSPYSTWFKEVDGVLFSEDGKILYCYPAGKTDPEYHVPSTVERIEEYAFSYNEHLESLYLNEGLITTGVYSILDCKNLSYIHIPSTVAYMAGPFACFCWSLEEVDVEPSNPWYISVDGVLFSKGMTTLLKYPSARDGSHFDVPEGVEILASYSLEWTDITSITIPSTLESFGQACLQHSGIQSLVIPSSVVAISEASFFGSSLQTVTFEGIPLAIASESFEVASDSITEYYVQQKVPLERYCNGKTITYIQITSGSVPDGVQFTVDDILYETCSDETSYAMVKKYKGSGGSVYIPDRVEYDGVSIPVLEIGDSAFSYSTITDIRFPLGLRSIGDEAFIQCHEVTGTLVIPDSVEYIGSEAFFNAWFTNVSIGKGLKSLEDGAFAACGDMSYPRPGSGFTVDPGNPYFTTTSAPDTPGLLISKDGLTLYAALQCMTGKLIIPATVRTIAPGAFEWCTEFQGVITIPASVRDIGAKAFSNVGGTDFIVESGNRWYKAVGGLLLTYDGKDLLSCPKYHEGEITIPEGTERILEGAFYCNISSTGTVILPSSMRVVERIAFYGSHLNGVVLNDGLETIGEFAFELTDYIADGTLIIPSSVQTIGPYAFSGYGATDLVINGSPQVGHHAFGYNPIETIRFLQPMDGDLTNVFILYRSGYTFLGFFQDPEHTIPFSFKDGVPNPNTTVYAGWELKRCSIIYELDGGVNDPDNPTEYDETMGVKYLLPAQKDGYAFNGWYYISNGRQYDTNLITSGLFGSSSEITLYAKWGSSATVTFVFPDWSYTTMEVVPGGTIDALPVVPDIPGKEFRYWTLNGKEFDLSTPITSDITLLAFYESAGSEMNDIIVHGVITGKDSPVVYGENTRVVVTGTWELTGGANVTILGKIFVPDGSEIIIGPGCNLRLNGTSSDYDAVLIEGTMTISGPNGTLPGGRVYVSDMGVDVYGSLQIYGELNLDGSDIIFESGSDAVVWESGTMYCWRGVNREGSTFTIHGDVNLNAFDNYGTVVFDSEVNSRGGYIFLMCDGATVEIERFTTYSGFLLISDLFTTLYSHYDQSTGERNTIQMNDHNRSNIIDIALRAGNGGMISLTDLTIREDIISRPGSSTEYGYVPQVGKVFVNIMNIGGYVEADSPDGGEPEAYLLVNGGSLVTVDRHLVLREGISLYNTGSLKVSGKIDSTIGGSEFRNLNGEQTVLGVTDVFSGTVSVVDNGCLFLRDALPSMDGISASLFTTSYFGSVYYDYIAPFEVQGGYDHLHLDLNTVVWQFSVGDEFRTDGLKAYAVKADGTSVDVTDAVSVSQPDMTGGSELVYVTYMGMNSWYYIDVGSIIDDRYVVQFIIDDDVISYLITSDELPYMIPEIPSKKGYGEGYWTLDGERYDFFTPLTGDIILYAKWDPADCEISYSSDRPCDLPASVTVPFGGTLTLPEVGPIKGYTLEGWTDGKEIFTPGSEMKIEYAENTVMKAVWKYTPQIVSASISADGSRNYSLLNENVYFLEGVYRNAIFTINADVCEPGHTLLLEISGIDGDSIRVPLKSNGSYFITSDIQVFRGFLPTDGMTMCLIVDGSDESESIDVRMSIIDRDAIDFFPGFNVNDLIPTFKVNVTDPTVMQMLAKQFTFDLGPVQFSIVNDLSIIGIVETTIMINVDPDNPSGFIEDFLVDEAKTIRNASLGTMEINLIPNWKLKVECGGYLIINSDLEGHVLLCEGGFYAKVLNSFKAFSYTTWLVVVPVTFGVTFGSGFSFSLDFDYNYDLQEFRTNGMIDVTLISLTGSAALGVQDWFAVGVKVGGSVNMYIMFGEDVQDAGAYGKFFIKAYYTLRVLWWHVYGEATIVDWTIGSSPYAPFIMTLGFDDGTTVNLVNTWSGDTTVLEEWVASFASPRIMDIDGTPVMVFLRGDHETGETHLVLSRYADGSWSEPEDMFGGLSASFAVDDSTDTVVWQGLVVPDGKDIYTMEMEELLACHELFISSWNGTGFTEPLRLTDNDVYEGSPLVIGSPDGTKVLWTENDIIRMMDVDTGTVTTVYQGENTVSSFTACYDSGVLNIAVVEGKATGEGEDMSLDFILYESVDGNRSLIESSGVLYVKYIDGNLVWSTDGTISSKDPETLDMFGDRFFGIGVEKVSYDGLEYYVWFSGGSVMAAPVEDGMIGEGNVIATIPSGLTASFIDVDVIDDVWYITVIAYDSEGSLEDTDRYVHLSFVLDSVVDASISIDDYGEDYIDLLLENNGLTDLNGVKIVVDGSGIHKTIRLGMTIPAGDHYLYRYAVGELSASKELTFTFDVDGDTNEADNTVSMVFGTPVMHIDAHIGYGVEGRYTLYVEVSHTGLLDNLTITSYFPGGEWSESRSSSDVNLSTTSVRADKSLNKVPAGGSAEIRVVATTESEGRTYTAEAIVYVYNDGPVGGGSTVTFDDGISPETIRAVVGGSVEVIDAPAGYDGWYDGTLLYLPGEIYTVSGDVTLVPAESVTVDFVTDDGTLSFNIMKGTTVTTVPDIPAREGSGEGFWSIDGKEEFDLSAPIDSDITLTACYRSAYDGYIVMSGASQGYAYSAILSVGDSPIAEGTKVDVTFTVLEIATFMGMQIYKPVPVTDTIVVDREVQRLYQTGYDLDIILGSRYAVISMVSVMDGNSYGFMMLNHRQDSEVTIPDDDKTVSLLSYTDGKVFAAVFSPNVTDGLQADITFTALKKTEFMGMQIYKPVPVNRSFESQREDMGVTWRCYDLDDILGDNDSVISVVSVIDGENFGFISIDHRRADL